MKNISLLLWDYNCFLDELFINLKNDNIDISKLELDHICYRVSNNEKYNSLNKEILKYWKQLSENTISNRKIATYKLNEPIIYNNRKIYILEIPAPKEWSEYLDWFEHIEFVIKDSFENFIKNNSNINFVTKDLSKKNNPDIKIKYDKWSVKFHMDSLENVIKKEKNQIQ